MRVLIIDQKTLVWNDVASTAAVPILKCASEKKLNFRFTLSLGFVFQSSMATLFLTDIFIKTHLRKIVQIISETFLFYVAPLVQIKEQNSITINGLFWAIVQLKFS